MDIHYSNSISSISVNQVHNKLMQGIGNQIVYFTAVIDKEICRFEKST